ncbi:serine hydrolase [Diaminobutyricibacter sp. McL0608]|uniref:serine hydrolase n=1 Tax=Leifsonia sp. McL0608 TaxID=3143537 RepID=UPI0031F302C0
MRERAVMDDVRLMLDDGGLRGSFLVRDLDTGEEIGIDPEDTYPIASVVKVPLAVATLERMRRGELDGSTPVVVAPGLITTPGPTGISRFRHAATVAIEDLLYLSTSLSDGAAADALFELTPPQEVVSILAELDVHGIAVRHSAGELAETLAERLPAEEMHLAYELAILGATDGHGHRLPQLNTSVASVSTARALVDLLDALWRPARIDASVAGRVRELMGANLFRQRLAPDFGSEASLWSSKTGTVLNLRHEIGVVEHRDGPTFAIAALTESRVPSPQQPAAEALMGRAARILHDFLRDEGVSADR